MVRDELPPWVPVGRNDLLALTHGFHAGQGWAWLLIVSEALADGLALMPMSRCADIAGRHWDGLWTTLQRRRLAKQIGDQIHIVWVDSVLADAHARITKARNQRAGKGACRDG